MNAAASPDPTRTPAALAVLAASNLQYAQALAAAAASLAEESPRASVLAVAVRAEECAEVAASCARLAAWLEGVAAARKVAA